MGMLRKLKGASFVDGKSDINSNINLQVYSASWFLCRYGASSQLSHVNEFLVYAVHDVPVSCGTCVADTWSSKVESGFSDLGPWLSGLGPEIFASLRRCFAVCMRRVL